MKNSKGASVMEVIGWIAAFLAILTFVLFQFEATKDKLWRFIRPSIYKMNEDLKSENEKLKKYYEVFTNHQKDLKEAMEEKPSLLIIGTGAHGAMNIPNETLEKLKEKNIDTVFAKTGEAVKIYNEELQANKNIIACLHLTC